jgi:hypothetical protein
MLQIDLLIAPANSPRSAPASSHPISAMEVERQNHEAELLTLTGIHPSLFSSLATPPPRRLHPPSHVVLLYVVFFLNCCTKTTIEAVYASQISKSTFVIHNTN